MELAVAGLARDFEFVRQVPLTNLIDDVRQPIAVDIRDLEILPCRKQIVVNPREVAFAIIGKPVCHILREVRRPAFVDNVQIAIGVEVVELEDRPTARRAKHAVVLLPFDAVRHLREAVLAPVVEILEVRRAIGVCIDRVDHQVEITVVVDVTPLRTFLGQAVFVDDRIGKVLALHEREIPQPVILCIELRKFSRPRVQHFAIPDVDIAVVVHVQHSGEVGAAIELVERVIEHVRLSVVTKGMLARPLGRREVPVPEVHQHV